jgi:cytochrome c2
MPDSHSPSVPKRARLFSWGRVAIGIAWLVSLAVAAQAGVFVFVNKAAILRRLGRVETTGVLQTNLYAVGFQRVPAPIDGRYGAIAPLADGVLFSSRSGRLWFADSTRALRELTVRVPINVAEFESDPFTTSTVDKDHFAVKDLFVQGTDRGVRVIASHNQWDAENDCYVLRVSSVELPLDSLLGGADGAWRTLFDTRPCLALGLRGNGSTIPTIGAGGRIVALSEQEILVSVGIFVNDAQVTDDPESMLRPDWDYGKTIAIDLRTGEARPFTTGHRNPQGLATAPDSSIWLTEHAARGGDELNLLREGGNYGFPHVSYGTDYGSMDWPLSPVPGRHETHDKPVYAWVPSIGTSQLTVVGGSAFERWRGDLLVSSLVARSVFRVRMAEDRVVLVEPIVTGHRTRDIIETSRGEIVLLAEDGFLVYLVPLDAGADDPDLIPRERGQLVAIRCQGCHTFEQGGANGIGPNLFGIVGRRVASERDFAYSDALRAAGGQWTEDAIRRYIADPAAFAPGTSMELAFALEDEEAGNLMSFLRTLR